MFKSKISGRVSRARRLFRKRDLWVNAKVIQDFSSFYSLSTKRIKIFNILKNVSRGKENLVCVFLISNFILVLERAI